MPLYVSTRSLQTPADLSGRLELLRMAALERVALEGDEPLAADDAARLTPFDLLAHGTFLPSEMPHAPNLAAGDEDLRQRSVRRLAEHLDFCADRGVGRYTFMAGYALEETHDPALPSRPCGRARARDQLLRSLDRLAELAAARGVALGLMNGDARRPEMLGCEGPELRDLLATIQVPFLGVRLDVANLGLAAARRSFAPAEFLEPLKDGLVALRLHEVSREGRAYQLPAADGPTEELLAAHPEWHGLPIALAARGLALDRLLDAKERLEARLAPPVQGPMPV